ncbi:NADP-dependent phosphogluconate dehydrogenase [Arcticibacterium luteifluviistationis]|nr:NADP-dependent phosphogluconate dehydrogenase [Arcticibacterium luteifluviistationis]
MIVFVMGVSGCGKSTVGDMLAKELNVPFYDGDDFHPQVNINKMSEGIPLNDDDRQGWLESMNKKALAAKEGAVFACSALKEKYREILFKNTGNDAYLIYLEGSFELIDARMQARKDHFMPPDLLKSQFATLEVPNYGLHISIDQNPENILKDITNQMEKPTQEFGLVGLGVMGKSLARNLANHGFNLALYNRYAKGSEEKVAERFINEFDELKTAKGFEDMRGFVQSLEKPRRVFLMVNAGKVTDYVISELSELLDEGDVIIDGGNSHFTNTERRGAELAEKGIQFIGTGVSGGEEGALKGPSIMPSGDKTAYDKIAPYLEAIAAKDKNGKGCCTYVGKGGSGHYIKMVHNGIEYAEMQLLAEVFAILRYNNGLSPNVISTILEEWNKGVLSSYLLEITYKLLKKKEGDKYMVDIILDQAGNKGTGSWTTESMATLGIPATMISSALFARYISAFRTKRTELTAKFDFKIENQSTTEVEDLKKAYLLARLVNHQQGFELIAEASSRYEWGLNLSEIARIWTNGCIIRSGLMETLIDTLKNSTSLLLSENKEKLSSELQALRNIATVGINSGISMPCHLSALDYLNANLYNHPTANIIQAQRDFFGAHTYKRVDAANGKSYHTIWE